VTAVAVVLAAGEGRRFGGAKQLAPLHGRPLLEHALDAARALPRVVVVLGARADEVRAGADLAGCEVVVCHGWAEGLGASLRTGLQAAGDAERVVVLLGDQPGVTREAVLALAAAPGPVARAVYPDGPGHPVMLERDALATLDPRGDAGARALLQDAHPVAVPGRAHDVDVPTDLMEALP
jgi:molybdenum cofactor cytidylyltransferase